VPGEDNVPAVGSVMRGKHSRVESDPRLRPISPMSGISSGGADSSVPNHSPDAVPMRFVPLVRGAVGNTLPNGRRRWSPEDVPRCAATFPPSLTSLRQTVAHNHRAAVVRHVARQFRTSIAGQGCPPASDVFAADQRAAVRGRCPRSSVPTNEPHRTRHRESGTAEDPPTRGVPDIGEIARSLRNRLRRRECFPRITLPTGGQVVLAGHVALVGHVAKFGTTANPALLLVGRLGPRDVKQADCLCMRRFWNLFHPAVCVAGTMSDSTRRIFKKAKLDVDRAGEDRGSRRMVEAR